MRLVLALRPTLITAPELRREQWQELLSRSLPIGALAEITLLLHAVLEAPTPSCRSGESDIRPNTWSEANLVMPYEFFDNPNETGKSISNVFLFH